jgi:hypothetical protein
LLKLRLAAFREVHLRLAEHLRQVVDHLREEVVVQPSQSLIMVPVAILILFPILIQ